MNLKFHKDRTNKKTYFRKRDGPLELFDPELIS